MKLFIFQDPGLYYGQEYIPVVAEDERQAYAYLAEYLKVQGREQALQCRGQVWSLAPNDFVGNVPVPCVVDLPLSPGVVPQLIHIFLE